MKYCEKCKKAFENQTFCSECGGKLVDITINSTSAPAQNAPQSEPQHVPTTPTTPTTNTTNSSNNTLNLWLPVLLAAAGVFCGWYVSGLLGLVLGVIAVSLMQQQKHKGNSEPVPTALTWAGAVIAIIFWLYVIG